MTVELVSPERVLWSGEAEMVVARTPAGEIAFLAGHTPFVGALAIGEVRITGTDGSVQRAAVHGGFVEVTGTRVTILSDLAELGSDIDIARAEAARDRAEAARARALEADDAPALAEAVGSLKRAEIRLTVAGAVNELAH